MISHASPTPPVPIELLEELIDPSWGTLTLEQWRTELQCDLGWEEFGQSVRVYERRVRWSFDYAWLPCSLTCTFNRRRRVELRIGGTTGEVPLIEADLAMALDVRMPRGRSPGTWVGEGLIAKLSDPSVDERDVLITFTYAPDGAG